VPIPTPEPGLVISYAYLWHHEHEAGREEGRKDRPSVIVLTVERSANDATVLVVLPITQIAPADPAGAVEIPAAVKRPLGLDDERPGSLLRRATNSIGPAMIFEKSAAVTVMITVSCRRDFSIRSSKPLLHGIAPARQSLRPASDPQIGHVISGEARHSGKRQLNSGLAVFGISLRQLTEARRANQ
jgi:hypothetical protein